VRGGEEVGIGAAEGVLRAVEPDQRASAALISVNRPSTSLKYTWSGVLSRNVSSR